MTTQQQQQPFRPLAVKQDKTEISILVPANIWVKADELREEFPGVETTTDEEVTEIELAARFLKHAVQRNAQESQQFLEIVRIIFFDFRDRYLKRNDVHAVTRSLPAETRTVVINAYFTALVALQNAGVLTTKDHPTPQSALFSAAAKGDAKIFAVFGGQGNIEEYFDELAYIYSTYDGLVLPYLKKMSVVLQEHAESSDASVFHSKGLDVMKWLENPESKPDLQYFISAPVSLPLIGLTQLLHYFVLLKVLDKTPDELRRLIAGTTGHSQGIITSVAISASATEEDFYKNSAKAVGLLFWIGTRSQQVFPPTTLNPTILQDSLSNNEGNPTPMLAVAGLRLDQVQKHVEATNLHLSEDRQIKLTLINGPRSFVCTGPPQSLYGLNLSLRKVKAPTGLEQSRVPHSQRKIKFSSRFLPITAPFHSSYLLGVDEIIGKDVEKYELHFNTKDLTVPVYATDSVSREVQSRVSDVSRLSINIQTGKDLRSSKRLTLDLVDQICSLPVYWEKATAAKDLTHIIDFGPGGSSGIGGLTHRNKEGTGVQIILAGALAGGNKELSYKGDLFDTTLSAVKYSPNWANDYQPKLVKTTSNGNIHVDTRMSRLLGKPPMMVAGMTPSTVSEEFVSAVLNAGYHIELAGGGHYNEKAVRSKVAKIMALTRPGDGITMNILFLNVRQWGFQYPLVQIMRQEGLPMEGVCVAAGVPSPDVANEIMQNLHDSGIKHVSFKPGSVETIRAVISIAAANPHMSVMMQWTGGRAGGHHSFEDFHQPVLETYAAIRRQPNIVLVGGSGFGDAEDTLPYLTGDWALKFDYPSMPFDGVLFASRMMVAKEGLASEAAKQAIADAPGVDDSQWEKTYSGPAGGVMTVRSELGEPIHKIATRGVRLWKEMDDTIFNLPKDKRPAALLAKKDYIIKRLNADFQKVWFGKKATGEAADLQEMTYTEVVHRMMELLYIHTEHRWIDITLRNLLGDFLRRVEERFSKTEKVSTLQSYSQLDNPYDFVGDFLEEFPEAETQLLTSEDVFYFLTLCQRGGQKPVPFIPVLDKDFEIWFKKDSLWQAEDLGAVVDQDVQRTCILQGPTAVKYSTKVNQPVAEILGDIYQSHIKSLKERYYNNDDASIPAIEYLGGSPIQTTGLLAAVEEAGVKKFETPASESALPETNAWLETLAGPHYNWLRALLTSAIIIQDKKYTNNPLKRIFRPRVSQSVVIKSNVHGRVEKITVFDKRTWSATGKTAEHTPSIEATLLENNLIELHLLEKREEDLIPLRLLFKYQPEFGYAPIHEIVEGRNDRIKEFYYKLWFGVNANEDFLGTSVSAKFIGNSEGVDAVTIKEFCQAVGNQAELYVDHGHQVISAPMDFAIVVGWKAIIKAIFPKIIDGDLLKLVHLSNGFRMLDGAELLKVGDVVDTVAGINAIVNNESGKLVEVKGVVIRAGIAVMEVKSQFLYRGHFEDFHHTFQRTEETPIQVTLQTSKDIAVLRAKEWIHWNDESENYELSARSPLIFRLSSYVEFRNRTVFSKVKTTGTVSIQISTKEIVEIATVDYEAGESQGNPVIEYLKRNGQPIEQAVYFENGGYSVMPSESVFSSAVPSPSSNEPYAKVSGDYNPIHVNPYFADLAQLPGTITHGMWTSASTRKFVEIFAADNNPQRVIAYDVKFLDMVLPGDRLETKLFHTGMKNGRKIIKVETINQNNVKVVDGIAEVDQPTTSYVFTGQGSQEQGMGMALYDSSPVAKEIWDKADKHFLAQYGFSILEIVRHNPKEKTVHFGGPKGNAIRQNYMSMTYDVVKADGATKTMPLFPDINERTAFYTFKAPGGLLSATQFTQPSLTLMEKSAFEDMRSKGLVQQNCSFAGHSLGEYSALASIGDVLPIESLVDVVFYRGMTMQSAVQRDALGRSNYGMVAVNPSRVAKTFNDGALRYVIDAIARQSNGLLEIVNYNVENWQYVAAGELTNLDALANVLNYLKVAKIDLQKLMETMPLEEVKKQLSEIIGSALTKAHAKKKKDGGFIDLDRGHATIPLKGIDVPFHSSFLLSGVAPFRTYLAKKINPTFVNVSQLAGKYIPNVTAEPFSTSKAYIDNVYNLTSSPRLAKVLKGWSDNKYSTPALQQRLGYTLLVEILAYQFASPVRWIETQDQLFKNFGVERLIEIGPSPTLAGMAQRTLSLKYEAYDDALTNRRVNLCYSKDGKDIYYAIDPPAQEETAAPAASASKPAASIAATAAAPVAVAAPSPSAGPAAAISDMPVTASEVLLVIVAQKLKKAVEEVPASKAIKDLVGGKSTLQNEILGDLQKEFNNAVPEKSEETPLDELGANLGNTFSGSLGKHTSALIARMISAKMPGGFTLSNAKTYLTNTYGLGSGRVDGALLLGLTMEPAARLGSEPEAKAWLDSVAQGYARKAGITLGSSASAGGTAGGAAVAVINSEEFDAMKAKQNQLIYQQLNLYARYLNKDLHDGEKKYDEEKKVTLKLQADIDLWLAEHGDVYSDGIKPIFSSLKARRYDSYWNWVRQDALTMFYDIIFGKLAVVDRDITARCLHIMNRANPALMQYMQYHIDTCPENKGETYRLAKELGRSLIENCAEVLMAAPVYKDVTIPTGPKTEITPKGDIKYAEVPRPTCRKLAHYVKDMAAGGKVSEFSNRQKVQQNLAKIYKIIKNQNKMKKSNKLSIKDLYGDVIRAMAMSNTIIKEKKTKQRRSSVSGYTFAERPKVATKQAKSETIPFLHLKKKNPNDPSGWEFSNKLTGTYLDVLTEIATEGVTFENKTVLLTGAGKDSIGAEILKGLLSGGAQVVVTTSRYSRDATDYYQSIYQRHGSKGSTLIVVPFNQGSKQDVDALIEYIYNKDPKNGLGLDLDFVIPFAAIPENGREIDSIDSKSEFAHRAMLTNLLRLLGNIKTKKQINGFDTRPAQVILPLSPNHGTFGSDGLYSESKISLETLFNRWYSESWANYLIITGAVIGWTRGTGLMSPNNMVAEGIEKFGVRTFSAVEMSFNILGLMHPSMFELCQHEPLWADLNGGFQYIPNMQELSAKLRLEIRETADVRKAIVADNALDYAVVYGAEAERKHKSHKVTPRANMKFDFPKLKQYKELQHLSYLKGLIDLDQVVVVTGFGEVGPWGNSRTRWEMEANGEFSLEGCIEMAWIMGYIKHHHGPLKKNNQQYSGWVDAKTNEPVEDKDIKSKYEKQILEHTGIRLIEPEQWGGYDPNKKNFMQEVVIDHELEPFECSKEEASHFKLQHGDKVDTFETESGSWTVAIKKGAAIYVPKALRFDRLVAGTIPTGWDASRYGVPKDIIDQVDKVALFNIVSTVEALVASGITDPYEFYQYVHVSEIGNSTGSGVGGGSALRGLYRDRFLDKPVQQDILQESFINTMPAWINLLILSSSGPIKTPVNACATAAVSVEMAVETIQTGKAKIMIAGATEDITEESSYEFANMKATSNAVDEFAHGRTPREMSRPTTTTRSGFMESQGSGNHILMSASMAIEIGAPIYGIVALTNTASDKEGRSIPAPGAGILTTAREVPSHAQSPLLDIKYRARQLRARRQQISSWVQNEYEFLREELEELKANGKLAVSEEDWLAERAEFINKEARRQEKDALRTWSMEFWRKDPKIAALRGALATYGLTIDDIGIASFHGTSTKANDKNESRVLNEQFAHLGRTKGNCCLAITQKYLTGHPKGPAASWMLNGVIQSLTTGIAPGNRNGDNIDNVLRQFEYILYPSKSIQTDGLKAGLLKSFGFGQAGGEVLVIHPDYILGALEETEYNAYKIRNAKRQAKSYRYLHDSLTGVCDFVQVKSEAPYSDDLESRVYLNPQARAVYSKEKKSWHFNNASIVPTKSTGDVLATKAVLESIAKQQAGNKGVGVDVELTTAINIDNETFLERNFTLTERTYCLSRPDPQASFAGRWSAKEAVFKALSSYDDVVQSKGAAAPLSDIEVVVSTTGAPEVVLHGDAKAAAYAAGIKGVTVSISHSGAYSVAVALAQ
ncbi:fatty acid synthase [Jimgerdemannia flammicorona]|uniref:Fatty acid synthase n=1 Tax=Jimgerdemannia flammicorona TaxID=994334 RepID=A0A433D7R6_9FUNG|nr:fatty acid synthase [Jimgerdemannia flammicorona]